MLRGKEKRKLLMMETQRRCSWLQSLDCGKIWEKQPKQRYSVKNQHLPCKEEEDGSQLFKIIQNYLKSFNRRRKTAHRPREEDLARAQWPRIRQFFKNSKGNENKNIKNLARDQWPHIKENIPSLSAPRHKKTQFGRSVPFFRPKYGLASLNLCLRFIPIIMYKTIWMTPPPKFGQFKK